MLHNVVEIAKIAGNIAREGFRGNFQIDLKSNVLDLVTEYDKKCESAIIKYVNKNFPNHSILAEESGEAKKSSDYTWVIDPIDGTTNFAHGLPLFSVSIGVLKGNETVCGAVYDVMRDAMYAAELGSGSYCNERKIHVSENDDLSRSVLVTGFPYDIKDNPDAAIEKFAAFLKSCRAVRRLGSAAIDFCYVAEGVFDGFWEVSLNPWDICGGKLIVEEAGGIVTNFKGNSIDTFSKQILATNRLVHLDMIEILNKA